MSQISSTSSKTWSLFTTLILVPGIIFFVYAYLSIGKAVDSTVAQKQTRQILNGQNVNTPSSQTVRDLQMLTERLSAITNLVDPEAENVFSRPLQMVESAENSLIEVNSLLTRYQAMEGKLSSRIVQIVEEDRPFSLCAAELQDCRSRIQELENKLDQVSELMAIKHVDEGIYDVFFGFGNASTTPQIDAAIRFVADRESSVGRNNVELFGYSDTKGSEEMNCQLAARRIEAVKNQLLTDQELSIESVPLGEYDVPYNPDKNEQRDPRNRIVRIEFGLQHAANVQSGCDTNPSKRE